jgi:hypothetical protein
MRRHLTQQMDTVLLTAQEQTGQASDDHSKKQSRPTRQKNLEEHRKRQGDERHDNYVWIDVTDLNEEVQPNMEKGMRPGNFEAKDMFHLARSNQDGGA